MSTFKNVQNIFSDMTSYVLHKATVILHEHLEG
jgi:hypothetical protein